MQVKHKIYNLYDVIDYIGNVHLTTRSMDDWMETETLLGNDKLKYLELLIL